MCHFAKFHQNRSHDCRGMSILRFSERRPSAILDFWNSNVLTATAVKRPILHYRTNHHHREDRSNRCWDIAIVVIFKMATAAVLDFQKIEILTVNPSSSQISSKSNRSTVAEIWRFNGFYRAMLCIRGTSHGPVSVRLCLCLSVTSRSSTKTAKRRITQTTLHDSPGL